MNDFHAGLRDAGDGATALDLSRMLTGFVFLAGPAFDTVGRRTKLPRVTLLLIFGFAVGPSGLNLVPALTATRFALDRTASADAPS